MINVEHLTKTYGEVQALSDLSFTIDAGGVYGFLGPNGAGKTTTMNIITGCLSATAGSVTIGGHDVFEDADAAKRLVGYLPEQPPLYMNETPAEYLRFVGEAKGLRGEVLTQQVAQALETVRMTEMAGRRTGDLSKGYKQRLGIAQALLGDPDLIILDEPTVGLDPIQITWIRELIQSLGKTHTVLLSSHILSEVQAICDKILIIAHGRLVAFDTVAALEHDLLKTSCITLLTDAGENVVRQTLHTVPLLQEVRPCGTEDGWAQWQLLVAGGDLYETAQAVFAAFAGRGLSLAALKPEKTDLEAVFLELTETAAEVPDADEKEADDDAGDL